MSGVLYHENCLHNLYRKGKLREKDKETGLTESLIPDFEEFEMIKAGVRILGHCKATTQFFESEKKPTMGLVMERLYDMDHELAAYTDDCAAGEVAIQFAKELREQLQNRFPELLSGRELVRFANYLAPSLQGLHLRSIGKFESTKRELEAKLQDWKKDEEVEDSDKDPDEPEEMAPPPPKLTPTQLLRRQQMSATEAPVPARPGRRRLASTPNPLTNFQKECLVYEALPPADSTVDLLSWWTVHQE